MKNAIIIKKVAIAGLMMFLFLSLTGCGGGGSDFLPSPFKTSDPEPGPTPLPPPIPGDTTPPTVLSTVPAANATGSKINSSLTANFSETVWQGSITTSSFLLRDSNGTAVNGSVSTIGTSAKFTPNSYLNPNTTYTATITTDVIDLSANHLATAYIWTFTTDSQTDFIRPTILTTAPANAAMNVPLSSTVTATFSEPMDPTTITPATFTLKGMWGTPVAATVSCNGATATLTPVNKLTYREVYTACVSNAVKDLAGNQMQYDYCWNFSPPDNSGYFKPYTSIATGSWPEAVAIGDVNGDGRNDVVLVTSFYSDPEHDYKLFVFLQDSAGNLASAATYTTTGSYNHYPSSVAIGDINNDGKNEVVVGNSRQNIEIFTHDGSGNLVSSAIYTTVNSSRIKIADLNNDGRLDIVGVGAATNTLDVFLQNASGTLGPPTTYNVTHNGYEDIEVSDVNNDGLIDIIVKSDFGASVLLQKSDGTFNAPIYYDRGNGVSVGATGVGDVNGDGMKDVVVAYGWAGGGTSEIGVYLQNNSGSLNPPITYPALGAEALEIADVDMDGRQDVITLQSYYLGIHLQSADGSLKSQELYSLPYASHYNQHGLAVGDINGDGRNDIVIADFNRLVILYHQTP